MSEERFAELVEIVMKEIWESGSKSDKVIYVVAIVAGVPLALWLNWDERGHSPAFYLWQMIIIPFFLGILLIALRGCVMQFVSQEAYENETEIPILAAILTFLLSLVFKSQLGILGAVILGLIVLVREFKMRVNRKERTKVK